MNNQEDHDKFGLFYDSPYTESWSRPHRDALHEIKAQLQEELDNKLYELQVELSYWWTRIPHGIKHTMLRWQFWAGMTLGFPLEHWLWEHVWPFVLLTRWLGL